jgi:hypothetical protein
VIDFLARQMWLRLPIGAKLASSLPPVNSPDN